MVASKKLPPNPRVCDVALLEKRVFEDIIKLGTLEAGAGGGLAQSTDKSPHKKDRRGLVTSDTVLVRQGWQP